MHTNMQAFESLCRRGGTTDSQACVVLVVLRTVNMPAILMIYYQFTLAAELVVNMQLHACARHVGVG
jgi:hypothetical protein